MGTANDSLVLHKLIDKDLCNSASGSNEHLLLSLIYNCALASFS